MATKKEEKENKKTTLESITGKTAPDDIIKVLKQKTIQVEPWEKLKTEYDPKLHPVVTDPHYKDKVVDGVTEKVTRITLAYQRLAANRMTQLTFGIPVKRIYKAKTDKEKRASRILEDIFMQNRIDSINMQRGVMLFAGCEFATMWYGATSDSTYYDGEKSALKIRCESYTPMDDKRISYAQKANLYPYFNEYNDMVAMSFEYTRKIGDDETTYFDVYTASEHVRYAKDSKSKEWTEDNVREEISIEKIPVGYCFRPTSIWEDTSDNIYEAEWQLSFNGNYLRKNMRPILGVYDDEDIKYGNEESEKKNISKDVVQLSSKGRMAYTTWEQGIETLKYQVKEIKENYFAELQLPDISSESLKVSNVSADALEIMLLDSQLKVTQESGIFLDFFFRETNIVKALAKKAYPILAQAFDTLFVEHLITPYYINDDTKKTNNLVTATGGKSIMSQRTAIAQFGQVDDVDAELNLIKEEEMRDLSEPTDLM